MNKLTNFSLFTASINDYKKLNSQIIEGLNIYIDDDLTRKTHHFFGRYENIYIGTDKIPALDKVLDSAKDFASTILNCPTNDLKAGLWFNVMNPGDKTTMHRHDDDDELLSAVYYVQVAKNSGTLHLVKDPVHMQVTPKEGMFAFFPPDMPHEVSENMSEYCRVSLGINIGPA